MKKFFIFTAFVVLALSSASAIGAPSPDDDGEYYSLRTYLFEVEKRENLIGVLRLKPKSGWKWNEKYPVNLSILKPENGKRPYKLAEQHVEQIELEGDPIPEVAIWMDLQPSKVAKVYRQRFTVRARYSFCDKTTCRVFKRDIKF